MTVSTTDTRVSYAGDDATVAFTFDFATQEVVDIIPSIDGVDQSTGFTAVLNSDQELSPGGTVTFDTAPTSAETVVIRREVPLTQNADYNPYDPFLAQSHENALDKLTMADQQLLALIGDLVTAKLEWVAAPASASDIGTAGQVAYDSTYLYVCVDTDTWGRITLETW